MIAAWSDSDSSDSDKEEEIVNLCLMANEIQETEPENLDELDSVSYTHLTLPTKRIV